MKAGTKPHHNLSTNHRSGAQTLFFRCLGHICWNHITCQHPTAFDLQKWHVRVAQPNRKRPAVGAASGAGRVLVAKGQNLQGQLVARVQRERVGRREEGITMTGDASEGHADPGKRAALAEGEKKSAGAGGQSQFLN